MRILITNDDGIDAPGIIRLAEAAVRHGEVLVVAPDGQRSAQSHSITYKLPVRVRSHAFPVEGVRAFSCSGTPADCVRIAIIALMPECPDYVMAGINDNYNVSHDIRYSATIGAAMEATSLGVRAIAFSQGSLRHSDVVDGYLDQAMTECMRQDPGDKAIWNVNFPACSLEECHGVLWDRTVSQDPFYRDSYRRDVVGQNEWSYTVVPGRDWRGSEGTDLAAVVDNYVSIGRVKDLG